MHTTILSQPSQKLAAILPCYDSQGDSVTLLTPAGTSSQLPVSIRTALRRLAKARAIDLSALKQQTERATGQRILHTLPLADDLVLVPVKVRIPQVSRDNCTGYINCCYVKAVCATANPPYKSLVVLTSGTEIPSLWSAATVEKHLRAARLLAGKPTYGVQACAQPEIAAISRKLVEVFQDILALKARNDAESP